MKLTLEQMVSLTYNRQSGFRVILNELRQIENPILFETGSARLPDPRWGTFENNFKDDGMSTLIWDAFINEHGGESYTVDIDRAAIDYVSTYVSHKAQLACQDSLSYIRSKTIEFRKLNKKVNFVYFDSFPSALYHLQELCAIMPILADNAIIAVDDNYGKPDDRGTLIHEFMNNIKVPIIHNGIQKVWKL